MIIFRKLYARVDEFGMVDHASIMLNKKAITFRTEHVGRDLFRTVPCQYSYQLTIDLWFVILNFSWKSKDESDIIKK